MSTASSSQGFTPAQAPATSSGDPADLPEQETARKHRLSEELESQRDNKRQRTDHDRDIKEDITPKTTSLSTPSTFYKLGTTIIPRSQPHVESDLMSLYSLKAMQHSVRRALPGLPDSGVKLRKSYDGKVKDLEGKVKNTVRPGMLFSLLQHPDEEWHVQKVLGKELVKWDRDGKEIGGVDPGEALLAKLGQATTLAPGRLPADERAKWQSLLGSDDFSSKSSSALKADKATPAPAFRPQPHHSTSAPGSPRGISTAPRPKRQGTKRRYHDDSFEGYGEGFVDDHADNVSMSGADDDTRSVGGTIKKRRKVRIVKLRDGVQIEAVKPCDCEKENQNQVNTTLNEDYEIWLALKPAELKRAEVSTGESGLTRPLDRDEGASEADRGGKALKASRVSRAGKSGRGGKRKSKK